MMVSGGWAKECGDRGTHVNGLPASSARGDVVVVVVQNKYYYDI